MNEIMEASPGKLGEATIAEKKLAVLAFEAPFLEKKTLRDGLFHSREEYREAFTEVKKYLWLYGVTAQPYPMTSRTIDELWHQFILFTLEYHDFCERFFGRYLHHSPDESSDSPPEDTGLVREFFRAYQENFGKVSRLWLDRPPEENAFLAFAAGLAWGSIAKGR